MSFLGRYKGRKVCQLVPALEARVSMLARMDQDIHGLPQEWPDEALEVGVPVWVEVPGLPQFGIMPGVIGYSDIHYDVEGNRDGYVGIEVERNLPITGKVTYTKIGAFTFWPRSVEVPSSVQALASL